jgi:soluble lytic murein transglycosylase
VRRLTLLVLAVVAVGGLTAAYALAVEPGWYVRARYPLRYEDHIRAHARNYQLDPALVAAVAYTESKFRPSTRSSAGAVGVMQLLPETARGIAIRTGGSRFTPADLHDPEISLRYGCWYLRHLRAKYAERPNAMDLALAAYNAGQANVDRWIEETPPGTPVRIRFAETRAYVERVRHLEELYRRGYGLEPEGSTDPGGEARPGSRRPAGRLVASGR